MSEPQKLLRLRNVHRGREAHHVVHLTRLGAADERADTDYYEFVEDAMRRAREGRFAYKVMGGPSFRSSRSDHLLEMANLTPQCPVHAVGGTRPMSEEARCWEGARNHRSGPRSLYVAVRQGEAVQRRHWVMLGLRWRSPTS